MSTTPTEAVPGAPISAEGSIEPRYGQAIGRLGKAFQPDKHDPKEVLAEAEAEIKVFTPAGCAERYGLRSGFILEKEFYCDILASNAGAVARILEQDNRADEAKERLAAIYDDVAAAGFDRAGEFFHNRIDSRTFMPLRRHIDRAYLERIGMTHLDKIFLCVGDCQTMQMAERLRHALTLPGMDMAAYQHGLGSLVSSPLEELFAPDTFFFFVNAAADFGIFKREDYGPARKERLDAIRDLVRWLTEKQVRRSVFVTHVFFGVDNAVERNGVPREIAMEAVTTFSDRVAEELAKAPGAVLVNFQEVCPFTAGTEAFRDNPTGGNQLHFRLEIMARLADVLAERLSDLA